MNLLIVGNPYSIHIYRLVKGVSMFSDVQYISVASDRKENIQNNNLFEYPVNTRIFFPPSETFSPFNKVQRFSYLRKWLRGTILNNKYDIVNVQAVTKRNVIMGLIAQRFISKIYCMAPAFVVSFWGGELWETQSLLTRSLQWYSLMKSQIITVIHEDMKFRVVHSFGRMLSSKLRIVKYYTDLLDIMDSITAEDIKNFKHRLKLPYDSIIVTISYASAPRHRQDRILKALEEICDVLKTKKVYLLIPLTYGDQAWKKKILSIVKNHRCRNNIRVINGFLDNHNIAVLRKVTDVFINLPTQDTLSAAMQEHLYAGSVVITGKWLPYSILRDKNCFLIEIDKKDHFEPELVKTITCVLNAMSDFKERCKVNRKIVKTLNSEGWDTWLNIYKESIRKAMYK